LRLLLTHHLLALAPLVLTCLGLSLVLLRLLLASHLLTLAALVLASWAGPDSAGLLLASHLLTLAAWFSRAWAGSVAPVAGEPPLTLAALVLASLGLGLILLRCCWRAIS